MFGMLLNKHRHKHADRSMKWICCSEKKKKISNKDVAIFFLAVLLFLKIDTQIGKFISLNIKYIVSVLFSIEYMSIKN